MRHPSQREAGIGERGTRCSADEAPFTQRLLEKRDAPVERRWPEPQRSSRRADATVLLHGGQASQVVPLNCFHTKSAVIYHERAPMQADRSWLGAVVVSSVLACAAIACGGRPSGADDSSAPAALADDGPLFEAIPMGAPWPEAIPSGARPKVKEVPARLEGFDLRASVLLACGGSVAGVAGDIDVPGVDDAVTLGGRLRARFTRAGFTEEATIGGPVDELLEVTQRFAGRMKQDGVLPGPDDIPKAWSESKLDRALFARDAVHLAFFARHDRTRTLQVMCLRSRCKVSVTEELVKCNSPGGIVMADVSEGDSAP